MSKASRGGLTVKGTLATSLVQLARAAFEEAAALKAAADVQRAGELRARLQAKVDRQKAALEAHERLEKLKAQAAPADGGGGGGGGAAAAASESKGEEDSAATRGAAGKAEE